MKAKIKIFKELPFVEGKTYTTKFQTGEKFLLKEIVWKISKLDGKRLQMLLFKGIYEKNPEIGICPLGIDRLIPDQEYVGTEEICSKCKTPLNEDI